MTHVDLQPSIVVTDQLCEQRKPRSYSIEPRRVTSPHTESCKLSESFDTGNKVTRSVSDSKKEQIDATRPADSVPFWREDRPASMIVPSTGIEDITSFVMNERSRSGSLDSPPDDAETSRNESFRSTSSDTILSRSDMLRNEIRRQIKPSSSAPEVSKVTSGVQRRHSDGASDARYSRRSVLSQERTSISVSSSNTSVSTERGALSRDNSFKNRHRDISELDEGSHDESAVGRSTPSFFLELEDNAELKEAVIESANSMPILVDQDCQTESLVFFSEIDCQTDDIQRIVSKVDNEVQTDFELLHSGISDNKKDFGETGTQCDLIQRVLDCSDASHEHHAINFQRAASTNDESQRSWTNIRKRPGSPAAYSLRSCHSESDLRRSQIYGVHYRSLSDDCNFEMATDANGNHESPVIRKKSSSCERLSPGMLALQSLSNSLECSIQPKATGGLDKDMMLGQRSQNSPLSLRRVALLNSSPVSKRKETNNRKKGSTKGLESVSSKRITWHVDSVSELEKFEKEILHRSKDDLSMVASNADFRGKGEEKPKRPDRKKNKGKKKDEKKKKKKDAESHGVVSGPNMDKRKAQRVFLENSLMHEKP